MTTTNNAKATRITLNSIVFANAPVLAAVAEGEQPHSKEVIAQHKTQVAEFVANQGKELAGYILGKVETPDVILAILKEAAKQVPAVQKQLAEEAAKAEAEAAEQRKKDAEAAEAKRKADEEALQAEKDKMLKILTDSGLDLEIAQTMVAAGLKAKAPANAPKNSYERVAVTVNGKGYDVPVRGNMSEELKALVAKDGGDREAFINKYRNEPAAAETNTAE
ncbi:hypothetical protein FDH34_gp001 [Serratia phage BF]|uniref:Uncharacterized protein n=1 Tax=Serratia phage BF TaxID=1962671 RepID=A0A1S6U9W6_9CAUD|nr:hypothetical protein FDH34_gp001 [Serratia phage BF]AQW88526.1 hypothetical protein BF_0001 [Serratia phage BF]